MGSVKIYRLLNCVELSGSPFLGAGVVMIATPTRKYFFLGKGFTSSQPPASLAPARTAIACPGAFALF